MLYLKQKGHRIYRIEFIMAKLLRHMAKFRYWKLTPEEMEKVDHDEDLSLINI